MARTHHQADHSMLKRKSILIVADSTRDGLGFAVRAEAEWFAERGWRVTVASSETFPTRTPVRFCELLVPARVLNVREMGRAARRAHAIVDRLGASVIHAHGVRSLLVVRLGGSRAYLTLHGPPWARTDLGTRLKRTLVAVAGALAQKAFSVSPDMVGRGWIFAPHASPRLAELRQYAPLNKELPTFLWIGALQSRKNPHLFVRAVAEAAQVCAMRGIIVGSGPGETSVRQLIRQLEAPIELLPYTEELATLYESSTAVVLTSFSEGVPFVLEEAMWCGRPVIASDLAGIRWLVGDSRLLFRSQPELVEALLALSDAEVAASLGSECAARVRRLLTPDSPWPETERLYLEGQLEQSDVPIAQSP